MNLRQDLSTSTPASEVSAADFARSERNDSVKGDETALPNFDDILRNSPAAELIGLKKKSADESLPNEEGEVAPVKSDEEVPSETSDETVTDTDDEKSTKTDEEGTDAADDNKSTQDAPLPTEEEIDWEYKIPVKVDGKLEYKTLEEVRKGFQTDQYLSQKGREIGERTKKAETEAAKKLQDVISIGSVMHEELTAAETAMAKEYAELSAQITKAQDDGDTYTSRELKEKREAIQEKYWEKRNSRESKTKLVVEQIQARQAEEQQQLLSYFNENITKVLPEYTPKLAQSIREFALSEGITEDLLNTVYSPVVVKVLNEYRKLKTAKNTGEAKRKAVPLVKSIPSKKGPSQQTKTQRSEDNLRDKVLSGTGSAADQTDFLKNISKIRHKL